MDLFCKDCLLQYEQRRLSWIHPSCIEALVKRKKELSHHSRAIGGSENPEVPTSFGGHNPLVEIELSNQPAPSETKGLTHKCPTCEFTAPCKGVLKKHIEANHKREFKCTTCNFSTPKRADLRIHQGSIRGRFEYVPLSAIMYMLIFFKSHTVYN